MLVITFLSLQEPDSNSLSFCLIHSLSHGINSDFSYSLVTSHAILIPTSTLFLAREESYECLVISSLVSSDSLSSFPFLLSLLSNTRRGAIYLQGRMANSFTALLSILFLSVKSFSLSSCKNSLLLMSCCPLLPLLILSSCSHWFFSLCCTLFPVLLWFLLILHPYYSCNRHQGLFCSGCCAFFSF